MSEPENVLREIHETLPDGQSLSLHGTGGYWFWALRTEMVDGSNHRFGGPFLSAAGAVVHARWNLPVESGAL